MNYEISDYYRFWFRVWHPKYPDAGWDEPVMLYSYKESDQVFIQNALEYAWKNHEGEGCVIMQCTGLKDSEGALIYEADILSDCGDMYEERYVVRFGHYDNGQAYDDNIKGYGWYQSFELFLIKGKPTPLDSWQSTVQDLDWLPYGTKIIGNIYENPELLNDKV